MFAAVRAPTRRGGRVGRGERRAEARAREGVGHGERGRRKGERGSERRAAKERGRGGATGTGAGGTKNRGVEPEGAGRGGVGRRWGSETGVRASDEERGCRGASHGRGWRNARAPSRPAPLAPPPHRPIASLTFRSDAPTGAAPRDRLTPPLLLSPSRDRPSLPSASRLQEEKFSAAADRRGEARPPIGLPKLRSTDDGERRSRRAPMPPEVVIAAMVVVVLSWWVLVVVAVVAAVVVAAARTLLAFPFRFAPRSLAVLPCPSLLSSLSLSAPSPFRDLLSLGGGPSMSIAMSTLVSNIVVRYRGFSFFYSFALSRSLQPISSSRSPPLSFPLPAPAEETGHQPARFVRRHPLRLKRVDPRDIFFTRVSSEFERFLTFFSLQRKFDRKTRFFDSS